jgi:hypothetical protein
MIGEFLNGAARTMQVLNYPPVKVNQNTQKARGKEIAQERQRTVERSSDNFGKSGPRGQSLA